MQSTIPEGPYRIDDISRVMTPALAIYPQIVDSNIEATLRLLGNDPDRWRPHVKTAKLAFTISKLVDHGITAVKCATTLELLTSCEAGVADALLAYPVVGANAVRVRDIAAEYPDVKISVLVETPEQAALWEGSGIGVFIDVNSGMNRTGISQERAKDVVALAKALGPGFRGLHYYDGHMHIPDPDERRKQAWKGYDRLIELTHECIDAGATVGELITSGTPALISGANYPGFRSKQFDHRVSPGTVVYCDTTSIEELPHDAGYRPAVAVVASVVSHPMPNRFTVDAGHKAVSADAGVPTCAVAGHPEFTPLKPSEEHLPIEGSAPLPQIGDYVYLIPRHVCPTVNNFDEALIVEGGKITSVESVTARGRESLVLQP